MPAPDVVGPAEARKIIGVNTRERFRQYTQMDGFPEHTELGIGRVWDRAELEAWIRDRRQPGKRRRTTVLKSYKATGNVSRAARAANVSRPTAVIWLRELGVALPRDPH